jgi:diaminopimelate epimerase
MHVLKSTFANKLQMTLQFHKYHGTGNDFILLDNRAGDIQLSREQVAALCDRRFGIGADGLMLLETTPDADFRMVYYNSDGGESTMCGNGGRCIVAFAHALGIVGDKASFVAIDGMHHAQIKVDGIVSLEMKDVSTVEHYDGYAVLDTGSPHYIQWVGDVDNTDVFDTGRRIRNLAQFSPGGTNVNFVQCAGNDLRVRTYERGVEDETLSCGTGVTAAAIAASCNATGDFRYDIHTPGGRLEVTFSKDTADSARNVVLRGPAVAVYVGEINLP